MRMNRIAFVAFVVAVTVLGGGGAAWADLCLDVNDGEGMIVGKGFSLPGAGLCKSFNGYLMPDSHVMTGTACGTSDGSAIRFTLHSNGHPQNTPNPVPLSWAGSLSRSTLSGFIKNCFLIGGTCNPSFGLEKIQCPSSRPFDNPCNSLARPLLIDNIKP